MVATSKAGIDLLRNGDVNYSANFWYNEVYCPPDSDPLIELNDREAQDGER